MKTNTIIKNGTIFSGEIKKVKSYPASIQSNGEDTISTFLCFEVIDDKGWHCITVNDKGIVDKIVITDDEGGRIVDINNLSIKEYEFIIRMIEGAKYEI
ncbi:hypothetical protein [Peribacillus frigoritolerans]|uniref:hypothetical protein n=1 Tax=Peribacillus frigoritolerans TaxID=450367 RepID=UPI001F4FFA38|nr:hypothetical protein [Peribacillus frigoritolerans]MCK2018834.1 hypothetical protein [Peribacillus frigoritolerans]